MGTIAATDWETVKEWYADRVIDLLAASYIPDLKRTVLKRKGALTVRVADVQVAMLRFMP